MNDNVLVPSARIFSAICFIICLNHSFCIRFTGKDFSRVQRLCSAFDFLQIASLFLRGVDFKIV
jgi:hypothetical protein